MKTKLLFTAALMAATVGAQAVPNTGSSMLVQLLESQRLENNVAVLAEEAEESSLVDVSWYYIPNAKMTWLSGVMQDNDMAWTTDTKGQGWNYRVYALSTDPKADASKGDCPYPNGVERYIHTDQQYAANTKVLYQDLTGIPNGTYTVTLYAESRHLIDGKPHEGGLFVYANDVDTEITNGGGLMLYTLNNVQVTDGTLSLGVKTKDNSSADNHVVMAGVSLLSENDVEGLDAASESAPLDVTNAVTNAQCQATLGWRAGAGLGLGLIRDDVFPNLTTEDYEGSGIEVWQSNNSAKDVNVISQTLGGLPNGKYRLSVCAFGRNQGIPGEPIVENQLFVFANENQVAITQPKWEQISIDVTLTGGQDLVFGLYANAENTNNWQGISNVKLQYLGNVDLSELQAVYEELRANAANYEGRIPTAYYALLNNKVVEEVTEAGYNAVITELRSMIATAESMVASYALKTTMQTFNKETVASEEAEQVMTAALTSVDAAASVEELNAAVEALWTAVRSYAATVTDLAEGVEQTDVTFLAQNMDFSADHDVQNPKGWQTEPVLSLNGDNFRVLLNVADVNGEEYSGRMCERFFLENVRTTIGGQKVIYQALQNMPEGSYVMRAASFNRFNNSSSPAGKAAKLYVNDIDKEVNTTVLTYDSVAGVVGEDKVLEFGLKAIAAPDVNWYGLADVELYYCGQNTAALAQTLAENRVIAGTKATEGLPEGAIGILTDTNTPADMAGYETALVELSEAIDATYLADRYAGLNELVAEMDAFNWQTVASEAAETTFGGLIADAQSKLAGALTLADIDAINGLSAARLNYWAEVYDLAEDVERVDVTFMGDNMDMGNTANRGAWYTTKTTGRGNCGPMGANPDILGLNARFIESYVNIDNSQSTAYDSNTALIAQDLDGMAKGAYTFAAYTFNRREHFSDKNVTPNPIRLFVNGFAKEVSSSQFEAHSINGMVGGDGKLSFGFKASSNLNTDWHGIADAHLYYLGAGEDVTCDVVLDENSPYVALEDAKANVTLYRALKSERWNTFCVPFDMEVSALGEVKELTSAKVTEEGDDATLTFSNAASVKAGKAYIVKAGAEAVNPMTFVGVAVKGGDVPEAETVDGVKLQGNYVSGYVPLNAYFISDNMFYLADVENSAVLKGFRAYVTVEGNAGMAGVNRMLIDFGDATGIENVQAAEADKLVDVVTLDGMTVKAGVKKSEALDGLQKGIYIVDGKKYVVR